MNVDEDILTLLDEIIECQKLEIKAEQIPLILKIDGCIYYPCFIMHETDKYVTILHRTNKGEEFCKIMHKEYISDISIIYEQMMETPQNTKGEIMYA